MPNKTIYVSEEDLPIFERAQELSGSNLSAAIVQALLKFIELEQAKERGFEEITVIVNTQGAHRRKRFLGMRLVRWVRATENEKGTVIQNVYRTSKGRYALHTRTIPDWDLSWGDPEYAGDPGKWGLGNGIIKRIASWGFDYEAFGESGDYSLRIFETLEELKPNVSADLYRAITQAMEGPEIEDLDI